MPERRGVVTAFDQNQTAKMRELLNAAIKPETFQTAYTLAPSCGSATSFMASGLR